MSTNSAIIILGEQTFTAKYVHFDGSPEYMLPILSEHFTTDVSEILDSNGIGISAIQSDGTVISMNQHDNEEIISGANCDCIEIVLSRFGFLQYIYMWSTTVTEWYFAEVVSTTSISEWVRASDKPLYDLRKSID